MARLKVLFLTGEFPPRQGGVGDYTWRLGEALALQGTEVAVLTGHGSTGVSLPWGQLLPRLATTGWEIWDETSWALAETGAQVLHIQYQAAAFALHPAANFLPWRLKLGKAPARIVVTFHDLRVPYLFPKAGPMRPWAVRKLAQKADAAILTNQEDWEKARTWRKDGAHLIPIGSNIPLRPPPRYDRQIWRKRLGVGAEESLLVYFGLLNASKGVDTLFWALRNLLDRGWKARLLMLGGRTGDSDPTNLAYAEETEALVEELGLEEAIIWTGFISSSEVSAHFLAGDLCVLPFRDGVSLRRGSLMAALEHGLPILSTTTRVLPPELIEGENIELVSPDDPLALMDGIARLLENPPLRAKLSAGAKELAKGFSWEAIAQAHMRVYRELQ